MGTIQTEPSIIIFPDPTYHYSPPEITYGDSLNVRRLSGTLTQLDS